MLQLGQEAAICINGRYPFGLLPVSSGVTMCPVVHALLGVAHRSSCGLPPLMSQDDVVPKVRNHKQSGAGIGDVADDDAHVDYSHRKRGFILRGQLQVDLAAVAGRRCD
jgi:hypothetical protein